MLPDRPKPFMIMFAGPNGSGKTTLMRTLKQSGFEFGHYINPDDIALTLEGNYEERVRQAQKIADSQREMCLKNKASFSFETVMSHPSKIEVLKLAKQQGFKTTLFYVSTQTPDINVIRVKNRVFFGGHDVPEFKIRERYGKSLKLLPEAITHSGVAYLLDNSDGVNLFECEIRYEANMLKIGDQQFVLSESLFVKYSVFENLPAWMRQCIVEVFKMRTLFP